MTDNKMKGGTTYMEQYGCSGCASGCDISQARHFLTREEKIDMLKEYQKALETEAKGVSERIADLEKKK